jgi:hypothetical protein
LAPAGRVADSVTPIDIGKNRANVPGRPVFVKARAARENRLREGRPGRLYR